MDVYCQKCGEPWDVAELPEFSVEYDGGTAKDFRNGKGCPSCGWGDNLPDVQPKRGILSAMLFDLLGDDIDGIVAELEDADYIGLLDDE